ncbi:hypothetical protein [Kordia sp.]|uniref:hypothetical protein n=1 Tax=Kordia sp. TaxID=1965332 RepID=UPI003B5C706C
MRQILILICTTLLFSCTTKQPTRQSTGELTFTSVSLTNFYGATEAQHQGIINEINTALANPGKHKNNLELYQFLEKLEKHKLLTAPQILLYLEKDSLITVHLSEEAYEKIINFKYIDLYKEQKKVIVQLDIIQKDTRIFYAEKISSVTKVDGTSRINGRTMEFIEN